MARYSSIDPNDSRLGPISSRLKFGILRRRPSDETIKLTPNAINICREREVGHFDQILPNQRSRCLQFSWLILLLRFRSRRPLTICHSTEVPPGGYVVRIHIHASEAREANGCLRLIRRSKVVSYGKPHKDLLILDGRVRQHLIPCSTIRFLIDSRQKVSIFRVMNLSKFAIIHEYKTS